MSTNSRQPDEKQGVTQLAGQNGPERPMSLACLDESLHAVRQELPEEKCERLEQLAQQANEAHDLAKEAAIRFCRHSVEAGMALLEAQELCPKRTWGAWLKKHFDGSRSTAYRYMQQAKDAVALKGFVSVLTQNPSEELSRLFTRALKRLVGRQRTASIACDEMPGDAQAEVGLVISQGQPVETVAGSRTMEVVQSAALSPSPETLPLRSADGDPLTTIIVLLDELLTALRLAIESGQSLDYGQFVLDELERIRGDVDVCRLLVRDAHLGAPAPI